MDYTVLKRMFMFLCECTFSIFFSLRASFGDTQKSFNIHFQRSNCTYAVPVLQTMSSEFTAEMILI